MTRLISGDRASVKHKRYAQIHIRPKYLRVFINWAFATSCYKWAFIPPKGKSIGIHIILCVCVYICVVGGLICEGFLSMRRLLHDMSSESSGYSKIGKKDCMRTSLCFYWRYDDEDIFQSTNVSNLRQFEHISLTQWNNGWRSQKRIGSTLY